MFNTYCFSTTTKVTRTPLNVTLYVQSDTKKKGELFKNPTKIEEIKKKILTETEPLQLAF